MCLLKRHFGPRMGFTMVNLRKRRESRLVIDLEVAAGTTASTTGSTAGGTTSTAGAARGAVYDGEISTGS